MNGIENDLDRKTNSLLSLLTPKPRVRSIAGANYGTPYQSGETPLGETMEHGE
ncbi:MAG: hypothetical protein JJ693_07915 [Acidithiobacillus sp.]|nr:hypothetical protein [Acidithiobacillus sp.]